MFRRFFWCNIAPDLVLGPALVRTICETCRSARRKAKCQSASVLSLRDLLTIEEAAERLKLAPKTVRKLCLSRRLTALRIQRSWRIPLAALDEFLLERLIPRV